MAITTLDVARSQLGVMEATGKNDGVPAERYNHGDELPWCSAFVLWCNAKSDDPKYVRLTGDTYKLRSVQAFEDACKVRGWWKQPARPEPGDVIFFASRGGSDVGGGRHVGIVEQVDDVVGGIVVHTIEGNYANKVSAVTHDLRDAKVRDRITGYARAV